MRGVINLNENFYFFKFSVDSACIILSWHLCKYYQRICQTSSRDSMCACVRAYIYIFNSFNSRLTFQVCFVTRKNKNI